MLDFQQLVDIVKKVANDVRTDEKSSPKAIIISATELKKVCLELYQNQATYCDMLSCLTGLDNGVEANTLELAYNLYSIPFNHHLMLKVVVPRENSEVDTVSDIWRTANWHERETSEMFGIKFIGHPDPRRLLLPADWEGNPLRKDYQHQEKYRDITVKY
ncbi:MAG TPA: NADH-quinone oxidoreductase subunit C [Saprospiraceae bacterium]